MKRPSDDNTTRIPGTNIHANAAGLAWWERWKTEQTADPYRQHRCLWADFQCPFHRAGQGFICESPKNHAPELADVCTWNWKMERRAIENVQLSLFEQVQTHKTVWVNTVDGRISETYPTPVTVVPSCKKMAVAHVRWLENKQGWNNQTWRILPRTDTKADRAWKDEMIERHNLRACIFDEF